MSNSANQCTVAESILDDAVTTNAIADGTVNADDVDSDSVQLRISESCAAGQYIQAIGSDGTVTCGQDNGGAANLITTVATGPSINANSFGVDSLDCPRSHPRVVSCGIDLFNVLTMAVTANSPCIGGNRAVLSDDGTYTNEPDGCFAAARNDGTTTQEIGFKMTATCTR